MLNYAKTSEIIANGDIKAYLFYGRQSTDTTISGRLYQGGKEGLYLFPNPDTDYHTVYDWKAALFNKLIETPAYARYDQLEVSNFKWSGDGYMDVLGVYSLPAVIKVVLAIPIKDSTESTATEYTNYEFYNVVGLPERRANGFRLSIERDVWPEGVYFGFTNTVHVRQSTYMLGTGDGNNIIYRVPEAAGNDNGLTQARHFFTESSVITSGEIGIAALIIYDFDEVESLTSDARQRQDVFIFYPNQVLNAIDEGERAVNDPVSKSDMRTVVEAIAQIYQNLYWLNQEATVQKMWFLPTYQNAIIDTSRLGAFYAYSGDTKITIGGYAANYTQYIARHSYFIGTDVPIDINNKIYGITTGDGSGADTYLLNCTGCKITFGTIYKGVELPRTIGWGAVTERLTFTNDGVTLELIVDGQIVDISEEWEISFTNAQSSLTSEQKLAKGVSSIVSIISGTALGIGSSKAGSAIGIAGQAIGAGGTANAVLGGLGWGSQHGQNPSYGSGSGWANYENILSNGSGSPLWFNIYINPNLYPSTGDYIEYVPSANIEKYVATNGAYVDYYYTEATTTWYNWDKLAILMYRILNTWGGALTELTDYNRQCIAADVEYVGIPSEVAEKMQNEISAGIQFDLL